jgi:hypothetical protein
MASKVNTNQMRGVSEEGGDDFSMRAPVSFGMAGHVLNVTRLNYMLLIESDPFLSAQSLWGTYPIRHGKK